MLPAHNHSLSVALEPISAITPATPRETTDKSPKEIFTISFASAVVSGILPSR